MFTPAAHTGILGAFFTFAGVPFYPVYLGQHLGSALEDQQAAGLVLWLPSGGVLTLIGIGLFAAWLGEAERRQQSSHPWGL